MAVLPIILQLLALLIAVRVFERSEKILLSAAVYATLRTLLLLLLVMLTRETDSDFFIFAATYWAFLLAYWSAAFYLLVSLTGTAFRLYFVAIILELLGQYVWSVIAKSLF